MRPKATTARPIVAEAPPVNANSEAPISAAPTAGPSQWRMPPSTLISTT